MNYIKKSIIFSILIITFIQIFLVINNRQKTSFRYFIWNIQNVSIGRLISISFVSGFLVSSLLAKTLQYNYRNDSVKKEEDEDKTSTQYENSVNNEENNELDEIPPERDLRDPQPTISVNYRIIKDNDENQIMDRNQTSNRSDYQDDWEQNNSEW